MRSSFLRSPASCSSRRTSSPFVRGTSTQRDRIVCSIRSTLFLGFHRPRTYLWRPLLGSPALGDLVFIGLGLFDEKDITLKGLEIARAADAVFAEFYTSSLRGTTVETLRLMIGKPIRVLSRKDLEQGSEVIEAARHGTAALLVPGDPMSATTHIELRLRADDEGIRTRIVHGPSIVSAAAGLLGLQSYKFGRATTVPFADDKFRPASPLEVIEENRKRGLHTLVLLDLKEGGEFLTAPEAIRYLLELAKEKKSKAFTRDTLVCVLGQAGSDTPSILAGRAGDLAARDLGRPLHTIVIPGELHFMEKEALIKIAGAPKDL
ncbi:MAG: diphthine synthase [Methanobacteriota archaeon]|nr:MAG: diphthine synthase [Euryarchaeota archaeon]